LLHVVYEVLWVSVDFGPIAPDSVSKKLCRRIRRRRQHDLFASRIFKRQLQFPGGAQKLPHTLCGSAAA
jgi:hypothetical protein